MVKKPKNTAVLAPEEEAKATFSFGMVFDINGTAVPISTADIAKIKEEGVQFELPKPVVLGSFANLIEWLDTTFGVKFPDTADLPDWLNDIVTAIINMEFSVLVFKLDVPGKKRPNDQVRYALEIAGTFVGEPLTPIPGFDFLGIQGGVFGVTNIAPAVE
ncbi:hypothetical protein GTA62_04775 [Roseobacter sp. HKCCD9010]|uniref:hypothetical protein n=1 Tax=Rhodobacterales TaxID=204455 RepID=UPI0014922FED|nr:MULTISPECIES: hypothetical protein [Rhodobacterales]MBF9048814.1 hypothetical protein [Rhodobacterales bacterium HKCCD4356]NNV10813.1 hypothetical protein [Roseobacter sp. HKCCD7357]NNV14998.1 hypothetical protein [Roseobacter sp. HKCCD8768]NNV24457.1 hypothetical protein [Roseobacter sp. HKCCD8192]NNV28714.1 hypothetical protein [Roseobacter sp. HKCCD9061]